MTGRSFLFDHLIVRSWWVIAMLLICLLLFDMGMQRKKEEYHRLLAKQNDLKQKILAAETRQEELKAEIASQNDPEWLELVLMRSLGLVPNGAEKFVVK